MYRAVLVFLSGFLFLCFQPTFGQPYTSDWSSIDKRPVPQWFMDAKFGIFIHWGLYSVPSWAPADADIGVYAKYAEWYWWRINEDSQAGKLFRDYHNERYGSHFYYQDFAGDFKAEHFNPDQWAGLFQKAGARYVVLTSKHHEGFTLWPSAQSWNWNSQDIGPHRDLCGDLSKAVKKAGLHMGFYYSLYEWYNPLYRSDPEKYVDDHMIPQMKDLVTRYEPELFWTDGEWDQPSEKWKSTEFLAWLFNESNVKDRVCINDRWGKETRGVHGGFYTTEYDLVNDKAGEVKPDHPWEECRGIGTSFGYNRTETTDNYMTSDALVDLLVAKVSGGGNLLLDIGPTADGQIPVIMQQRLLDMGKWLNVNGEAIYGSRAWYNRPVTEQPQTVFYTVNGDYLYVICTEWPVKPVVVPGLKKKGNVTLLGFNRKVKASFSRGRLTITPPVITPATNPSEYAWVFKVNMNDSK